MNPLTVETPLWVYLAAAAVAIGVSFAASWLKDHYELAGRRLTRRWYGTGAWVELAAPSCIGEQDRCYRVHAWDGEAVTFPWLLVQDMDDEDSAAFWAPVTDFAPYAVRRFRPHLTRGWMPVLFAHETLPGRPS